MVKQSSVFLLLQSPSKKELNSAFFTEYLGIYPNSFNIKSKKRWICGAISSEFSVFNPEIGLFHAVEKHGIYHCLKSYPLTVFGVVNNPLSESF